MIEMPNSLPMRDDEVEHLVAAGRVEAVRRLVEEHELRVVHERLGELHALPHAGRVAAHLAVALLEEADEAQDLGGALARGAARQAVDAGHVRHELGGADVEREAVVLGHVADVPADLEPLGDDVEVEHLRRAGGGLEQAEQDADQGALAGAVRPHQADDARLQVEVEPVEREDAPVPLRQPARLDERHRDSLAGPLSEAPRMVGRGAGLAAPRPNGRCG